MKCGLFRKRYPYHCIKSFFPMSIIFWLMTLLAFFALFHIGQFLIYAFPPEGNFFHLSPHTQFFSQYPDIVNTLQMFWLKLMPRWASSSAESKSFLLIVLWCFPSSASSLTSQMTLSMELQFFQILHCNCWCLINSLLFKAL